MLLVTEKIFKWVLILSSLMLMRSYFYKETLPEPGHYDLSNLKPPLQTMKHLAIFFIFLLPVSCNSEDLACKYKRSFIDNTIPAGESIQSVKWSNEIDKDSGEYISKLHIQYNNSDTAVVEHKYCDMYNFEYTYTFNHSSIVPTKETIANQSMLAFNLSKIKPTLKSKLDKLVLNELTQQQFDLATSFSIGLPVEQVTYNDNVEYGIEYSPAETGGAVASMIFYMSIGGE